VSTVAAERTAWTRTLAAPMRAFLAAETASAACLGLAAVAAVLWATADAGGYEHLWTTTASIRVGSHVLDLSLRDWVNAGLMTFFFFVVGLEARREMDVGELRERRRLILPVCAGLAGMALPVAIFLGVTGGSDAWGTAMSTDTAIALGVLAVLGRRVPDRLRAFVVTVLVVDDLASLLVIVFAYSSDVDVQPLLLALALFAVVLLLLRARVSTGAVYFAFGIAIWLALHAGGVEPVVVGIAFGLLTYAGPKGSGDLQRASDLFRLFREQPTPELARMARRGVAAAVSPNDRLQALYLPWTSYAIVPLFALENAGVPLHGDALRSAASSAIGVGIFVGYVVGKPLGIGLTTWLVGRLAPGLRPPVGWLSVTAGGAASAAPFTVSLLIAALALDGGDLQDAKLGVLAAAVCGPALAALVVRSASLLPLDRKLRAVLGHSESMVDLAVPVDLERDHVRGREDASVTLLEYGDFECPYCGRAEEALESLFGADADIRYVWRHLPLTDVHPHAQQAAEAAEAAALQGRFWELHDLLLDHQGALEPTDLVEYAESLGLDVDRFLDDLRRHAGGRRIADDVDSAELSGVAGTPTFFVNGRRHWGAYDAAGLTRAVREARARARVAATDA
jgi:Na+/H+ antiporter NhaA/glutaredoxin